MNLKNYLNEIVNFLKNYLNLIDAGEGAAIKEGWEVIYSALDNWEIDNPQAK